MRGDNIPSIVALCNKEGVQNPSLCGQSVIGFLLLISASVHRQFVDTLRNILRSPVNKEADTGGGTNGYHTLKTLNYLVRHPQALKWIWEEEQMGITHGNLLHTYNLLHAYKRECR